ncbi:hypothetical protein niasHT_018920 [Heterodera trifolii]|uniref:Glutathione synthetase n=1 Tax=Heterodera trifolii TaxID=157864 RepID=A0ABD2LF41_9BILA
MANQLLVSAPRHLDAYFAASLSIRRRPKRMAPPPPVGRRGGTDSESADGIGTFDVESQAARSSTPTGNGDNEEIDIQAIANDAKDFAQIISLTVLPNVHNGRSDVAEITPFSLFPTPFPRNLFRLAEKVQKAFNLLYFRISNDFEFLSETFEPVAKTNENVRRMLNILKQVHDEGIKQTKTVVLARSDYMCHVITDKETNEQKYELKQIEMNAGQIGGLSVSSRITEMHRRTLWRAGIDATKDQVPDNEAGLGAAEVLYKAWKAFGDPNAIILFVASRTSKNRYGQRHIEYDITNLAEAEGKAIQIVRLSLPGCAKMYKDGNEYDWETLLMFERSTTIMSPTIALDLATQKKVQQILAKPGMVEHYLEDQLEIVPLVRSTFAGLWSLTDKDEETQKAINDAIAHPEKYVIKPNLEGGGHNFFDEKLRKKLQEFTDEEREAHILMQKLSAMRVKNFMMRGHKKPQFGEMTTELGIFGFLLGDRSDGKVLHNVQRGHFMRTKLAEVNEGGVSHGTGVFDSAFLVP